MENLNDITHFVDISTFAYILCTKMCVQFDVRTIDISKLSCQPTKDVFDVRYIFPTAVSFTYVCIWVRWWWNQWSFSKKKFYWFVLFLLLRNNSTKIVIGINCKRHIAEVNVRGWSSVAKASYRYEKLFHVHKKKQKFLCDDSCFTSFCAIPIYTSFEHFLWCFFFADK